MFQGIGERTKQVRSLIREVAGWAPYEKRIMEILKGGGNNPTKRAWRFAKKRLGTHIRAKRKVAEMDRVIGEVKKQEAQAKSAAGQSSARQPQRGGSREEDHAARTRREAASINRRILRICSPSNPQLHPLLHARDVRARRRRASWRHHPLYCRAAG